MLRTTLLALSNHQGLRSWMEQSASARRLTNRFVAGHDLARALLAVVNIEASGIASTLDYLGESVTRMGEANQYRDTYLQALAEIQKAGLSATVSLKPSQFGLDLDAAACYDNVRTLLQASEDRSQRIEIDMESTAYTDRTLQMVQRLQAEFPGRIRAVIQAYLRRSDGDVETLCALSIPIRLCKGAYREDYVQAFEHKSEVDENYRHLCRKLFSIGTDPAIATHDPQMIGFAKEAATASGRSPQDFEFQMLYGIRRDLQTELVRDGFRLRLYVPFGEAWFPYFMRRLAERPANLLFLARNLWQQ